MKNTEAYTSQEISPAKLTNSVIGERNAEIPTPLDFSRAHTLHGTDTRAAQIVFPPHNQPVSSSDFERTLANYEKLIFTHASEFL